jgi:Tol biopolymer transport system component
VARTLWRTIFAGSWPLALLHCTPPDAEDRGSAVTDVREAIGTSSDGDCLSRTHPIAFVSNRSLLVQWNLYLMTSDGADALYVATGEFRAPAWSPDGGSIAFWLHRSNVAGREIGLIDPDGSEFVILDFDGLEFAADFSDSTLLEAPSWSSDGERLAFTSRRDGSSRIWSIDRSGGSAQVMFPELGTPHAGPSWSRSDPDLLAFVTRDGMGDIWIADVHEPQSALNLTQGRFPHPETPSWSPAGDQLAFSAQRVAGDETTREIYVLALGAGEPPRQLTQNDALDVQPSWSPDGQSLLITSNLARLADDRVTRAVAPVDLWLVPLDAPDHAQVLTRQRFDPEMGWVPQSGGHGMGDWAWGTTCD